MWLGWSGKHNMSDEYVPFLEHRTFNAATKYLYVITWLQVFADDKELDSKVNGNAKPFGQMDEESLGLEPLGPKVFK